MFHCLSCLVSGYQFLLSKDEAVVTMVTAYILLVDKLTENNFKAAQ